MFEIFVILASTIGVSLMVAIPLAVLLGLPLLAWNARSLIDLKRRELELRRLEVVSRGRPVGELPAYIDASDPEQLMAWAAAHRELRAV